MPLLLSFAVGLPSLPPSDLRFNARLAQAASEAAVWGRVTEKASGRPVPGAEVSLPAFGLSTTTSPSGSFGWASIPLSQPSQPVTVEVRASGYGDWVLRDALLIEDDTLQLEVELGPNPVEIVVPPPRSSTPDWQPVDGDRSGPDIVPSDPLGAPLPSTIRVRVTGYVYCDTSRPYTVEVIDFHEYVRHVLPNEWVPTWPREALRAGAMAAKMYAWRIISIGGKWSDADVYDSTCDQVYLPSVSYASTDRAIDWTWNWRLTKDGSLMNTAYRALYSQCVSAGLAGRCMGQWDTYYHALGNNGYDKLTWDEMLYRYYVGSLLTPVWDPPGGFSLRYYGNGSGDIDRVKIPLDAPARPIDVGDADFTLEWWMKVAAADNDSTAAACGANDGWIYGNILIDRDIYGPGDLGDYGVSLSGGRLAFGASVGASGTTACGATTVADDAWHHVAVTRRFSDGRLQIYLDGALDGEADGPDGDLRYADGRTTSYPNDPFLVLGAEKHDAGPSYPSYSGLIDELRISNVLRYDGDFSPPSGPFTTDSNTVGLYPFDEGFGNVIHDESGASGGPSQGVRNYGGAINGPEWSMANPFFPAFYDVPLGHWALPWISALAKAGLTAGYPDGTYRPDNLVTRAEMAVFLKKGIHGSSYTPPAPNGSHPFSDLAGHWAEAWMEELYDEGLTSGYPDGTYRPENQVTRAETAVFLLKAKHGSSYVAPDPAGGSFSDVAGHWAEAWIEQLKEEGVTSGYPDGTYRPENPVTRAEMAVFLVRAFNLPMP